MKILICGSWYIKCRGKRFLSWRYYYFTIAPHKRQSDVVIVIFHFALFIPLLPTDNPKNQNFENMKKTKYLKISSFYARIPKTKIICYTVPKIRHTMDAIVIFHFGLFLSFYPQTAKNMKISLKWKKFLEMSLFYTNAAKIIITCYTVPEIWQATDVIFIFHFALFFALFAYFGSPKNQNFKNMKNNTYRFEHFTQLCQKSWSYAILFVIYGMWQM